MTDVDIDLYCQRLVKSGLFTEQQIGEYRGQIPAGGGVDALVDFLVSQDLLTRFQDSRVRGGHIQGLLIGDYEVRDELGRGSRAMVYKAKHRDGGDPVVMKLLPPVVTQDKIAVKRFQREVDAMSRVKHKNVVQALDHGEAKNACFLIMELVEGHDLQQPISHGEPMDLELAVKCILQAARGLAEAHRRGVIHRDVKPANLLLTHDGVCKVLDLGLARLKDTATGEAGLTQTGSVMGTVDYLPPEQAFDSKAVDHRADIYALGATMYHLVTGVPMYPHGSLVEKIMSHRDGEIPSLQQFQPEAPEFLDLIYQKMVAKKADDRYATMDEVVTDLEMVLGEEAETAETAQSSNAGQTPENAEASDETGGTKTVEEGSLVEPTDLPDADAGVEQTTRDGKEVTIKIGPGGLLDTSEPSPFLDTTEESAAHESPNAQPTPSQSPTTGTTPSSSQVRDAKGPSVSAAPAATPQQETPQAPVKTPQSLMAEAVEQRGGSGPADSDDHAPLSAWWLLLIAFVIGAGIGGVWWFLKQ